MQTIQYYDGEKVIDVEVTEEVAAAYEEICREEERFDKYVKRYESKISLTQMQEENGRQFRDLRAPDPFEMIIDPEGQAEEKKKQARKKKKTKIALKTLTSRQKELVRLLQKGMGIREIARLLGKSHVAVLEMRKAVQKKVGKILQYTLPDCPI